MDRHRPGSLRPAALLHPLLFLLLLFLLALIPGLPGQAGESRSAGQATLEGWITGTAGNPLANATVRLVDSNGTGNATGSPVLATSDAVGHYTLNAGAPASYLLTATARGRNAWTTPLNLSHGENRVLNITLTPDVTAPVPVVSGPATVPQHVPATFSGNGSTDNAGIDRYQWMFTDEELQVLTGIGMTWSFSRLGPIPVNLTVYDEAGNTASATIIVNVTDGTPPEIAAGADVTIRMDRDMTFHAYALDNVDPKPALNITWIVESPFGNLTYHGVDATHRFNVTGNWTVLLAVRDRAGNEATDSLVAHVTPRDVRPAVVPIANGTVRVGDRYEARIIATDSDGDTLQYSLEAGPAGVKVGGLSGLITWSPDATQTGNHTITVNVSDALDTVNRTFSILVLPKITEIPIRVGPITDELGRPLKGAKVEVSRDAPSVGAPSGIVDADGVATVPVPVGWKGQAVTVVVSAPGAPRTTFTGLVTPDGLFIADHPPPMVRTGAGTGSGSTMEIVGALVIGAIVIAVLLVGRSRRPRPESAPPPKGRNPLSTRSSDKSDE